MQVTSPVTVVTKVEDLPQEDHATWKNQEQEPEDQMTRRVQVMQQRMTTLI